VSESYRYIFDPGICLSDRIVCLLKASEYPMSAWFWSSMKISPKVQSYVPLLSYNFRFSTCVGISIGDDIKNINLPEWISSVGFILSMFPVVWSEVLLWWHEGFV